jgi:hypothetical protein
LAMTIDLGEGKGSKIIYFEKPAVEDLNAIKMELEVFYTAIKNDTTPVVSIQDGYDALLVASQIIEQLQANNRSSLLL